MLAIHVTQRSGIDQTFYVPQALQLREPLGVIQQNISNQISSPTNSGSDFVTNLMPISRTAANLSYTSVPSTLPLISNRENLFRQETSASTSISNSTTVRVNLNEKTFRYSAPPLLTGPSTLNDKTVRFSAPHIASNSTNVVDSRNNRSFELGDNNIQSEILNVNSSVTAEYDESLSILENNDEQETENIQNIIEVDDKLKFTRMYRKFFTF